jgi:hypothetical protein
MKTYRSPSFTNESQVARPNIAVAKTGASQTAVDSKCVPLFSPVRIDGIGSMVHHRMLAHTKNVHRRTRLCTATAYKELFCCVPHSVAKGFFLAAWREIRPICHQIHESESMNSLIAFGRNKTAAHQAKDPFRFRSQISGAAISIVARITRCHFFDTRQICDARCDSSSAL